MAKIKLSLKTITPLIIKSGDDYQAVETYVDGKFFYYFDVNKILNSSLKEKFRQAIDEEFTKPRPDFSAIKKFFQTHLEDLQSCLIEKIPLDASVLSVSFQAFNISQFIRFYDFQERKSLPFIPGSSLKGAFLEVFYRQIDELVILEIDRNLYEELKKKQKQRILSYDQQRQLEEIQKKIKDFKQRIQTNIAFEDFYFKNLDRKITKLVRFNPIKSKEQVSVYVEAVEGEAEGYLYSPAGRTKVWEFDLWERIKRLFDLREAYYQARNRYFFQYFSDGFKSKLKVEEGLILPLGFGSRSFQKRPGRTYFSLKNGSFYDPVGVVSLQII